MAAAAGGCQCCRCPTLRPAWAAARCPGFAAAEQASRDIHTNTPTDSVNSLSLEFVSTEKERESTSEALDKCWHLLQCLGLLCDNDASQGPTSSGTLNYDIEARAHCYLTFTFLILQMER